MVNLTNIILPFLFICLPFWAHASATPAPLNNPALEHTITVLEKEIAQAAKSQQVPGIAIAIVSKDKVHYLKTFGVRRIGKNEPVTPYTLFQVASLSKPIHATMMAILQDKGKLSLHDPVSRYLPNFNMKHKQEPLKICHLMSHSSGVPSNGYNEQIEAFTPREKIVAKLQQARQVVAPGKKFTYHNAMYGMIGDVITKVSGKPLPQTLKEELFTPLGMRRACVGLHSMLETEDRAYPHVPNGRGKYMALKDYSMAYYAFPAAGGINASILDLVPLLQLYLGKPSPVVSKETLTQLTDPYLKNANSVMLYQTQKGRITDTGAGLGWQSMRYADKKVSYHQGHLKGFRNFMGFIQDDVGIIILTNGERKNALKYALRFFDLYVSSQNKTAKQLQQTPAAKTSIVQKIKQRNVAKKATPVVKPIAKKAKPQKIAKKAAPAAKKIKQAKAPARAVNKNKIANRNANRKRVKHATT